jgi:hypothetical protein
MFALLLRILHTPSLIQVPVRLRDALVSLRQPQDGGDLADQLERQILEMDDK